MPLRPHRPTKPGHHVLMTDECSNVSQVLEYLKSQCGGPANKSGQSFSYLSLQNGKVCGDKNDNFGADC